MNPLDGNIERCCQELKQDLNLTLTDSDGDGVIDMIDQEKKFKGARLIHVYNFRVIKMEFLTTKMMNHSLLRDTKWILKGVAVITG